MGSLARLGAVFQSEQRLDLLAGRLVAGMPAGAFIQPVAPSLMGAAAAEDRETRVLLDADGERLVMMAYELFQVSHGDFRAEVRRRHAGAGMPSVSGPTPVGGLSGSLSGLQILSIPCSPLDLSRQAVPLAEAYVRQADATIQQIALYVSPNAARDAEGCATLAARILRALGPGKRPLPSGAGPRVLGGFAEDDTLTLDVPDGWVLSTDRGISFHVHQLRRLASFEAAGGPFGNIVVYTGGHPSPRDPPPGARSEEIIVPLFGRPVTWRLSTDLAARAESGRATRTRQAVVPVPGAAHVLAHVTASANDPATEAEVDGIVRSLRTTSRATPGR